MGATFINIELEVRASFDLAELAEAFGKKFTINYCGKSTQNKYLLSGSLDNYPATPDEVATGLCKLVKRLNPSAKKIWKKASDRVFDIGLDVNLDNRVIVDLFRPETILQIAKVNARLAVSVYAVDLEKRVVKRNTPKKYRKEKSGRK